MRLALLGFGFAQVICLYSAAACRAEPTDSLPPEGQYELLNKPDGHRIRFVVSEGTIRLVAYKRPEDKEWAWLDNPAAQLSFHNGIARCEGVRYGKDAVYTIEWDTLRGIARRRCTYKGVTGDADEAVISNSQWTNGAKVDVKVPDTPAVPRDESKQDVSVAMEPWEWTMVDGQSFRAVPLSQAYDETEKQLVFIFRDIQGQEKRVPKSELNDGEAKRFGQFKKEQKEREVREQARVEAEKKAKKEAAVAEEDRRKQAELEAKSYTLTTGETVTGREIGMHNQKIADTEMPRFVLQLTNDERTKLDRAVRNFLPIKQALLTGDRGALGDWMKKVAGGGHQASREIEWLVEKTPFGSSVIPCADGRALHWREAWPDACRALMEKLKSESK